MVNSEYAYYLRDRDGDGKTDKSNSTDVDSIRHATWDIVMAGGYFVTGFGTTYFGGNRDPGPFDVDVAKNDVWEDDLRHVRSFFADLEWWRLQPSDELITAEVERGPDRSLKWLALPPAVAYWALADPGRLYLVYVRGHAGRFNLSLGSRPGGKLRDLAIRSPHGPVRRRRSAHRPNDGCVGSAGQEGLGVCRQSQEVTP